MITVGAYLKSLRVKNKLSVQVLSDLLQVERITIYHYEDGRMLPSMAILARYHYYLKADANYALKLIIEGSIK